MNASASESEFSSLLDALRRLDRVVALAARLKRQEGTIPAGLLEDFHEAHAALERLFVVVFPDLPDADQKALREFLLKTRKLPAKLLERSVESLARRLRSLQNHLLMAQEPHDDLTAALEFQENLDEALSPPTLGVDVPADEPKKRTEPIVSRPPAGAHPRRFKPWRVSALLALVLASAAFFVLYFTGQLGLWLGERSSGPEPFALAGNRASNSPPDNSSGAPMYPETAGFSRIDNGWPESLDRMPQVVTRNPLDVEGEPDPEAWPGLLLGLEELIHTYDPARLNAPPQETQQRLLEMSRELALREEEWIDAEKPLLDAVVAHATDRFGWTLYPEGEQALLSDVLNARGGPAFPLVVALMAVSRPAGCPFYLAAPYDVSRGMLAVPVEGGVATWDGRNLGLRLVRTDPVDLRLALAEVCRRAIPTLSADAAKLVIYGILAQIGLGLTEEEARAALDVLDLGLLAPAAFHADAATRALHEVAREVRTACAGMLLRGVSASRDLAELLKLYRQAAAAQAGDDAAAALRLVEGMVVRGAVVEERPLALWLGDAMAAEGRVEDALAWYRRALEEFPDDPEPALKLADLTEEDESRRCLASAYTRGERSAEFLRRLARALADDGDQAAALAVLDDLLASPEAAADDVAQAALLCIALEQPEWAQKRIAGAERFRDDPALLRLDLLCELSLHGYSDRARELAERWRERSENDPFMEGLLRRYEE